MLRGNSKGSAEELCWWLLAEEARNLTKRKRKPGWVGRTATMESSQANLRIDGPHQSPAPENGTVEPVAGDQPLPPGNGLAAGVHAASSVPPPEATDGATTVLASVPAAAAGVPPRQAPGPEDPLATAPVLAEVATPGPEHPSPLAIPVAAVPFPGSPDLTLPVAIAAPEAILSPLEERVRRLESALARMQDTQQLENRVAAKVTDQITQELAPVAGTPPTAGLVEIGKKLFEMALPPPPPRTLSPRPEGSRPGWLLWEVLAEARVIGRMYVDPRYRMTWVGRIVPIVLLLAFFWPSFVVWMIPVVNLLLLVKGVDGIVVTAMQLLIAYVMFKVLSHEARRYREVSRDLPASLRP